MAVPVVVTDIGGLAEAVENGRTGFVVPVRDTEALAAALQASVDDPDALRAMGDAARDRVQTEFSRDAMIDQTAGLMRTLAAEAMAT